MDQEITSSPSVTDAEIIDFATYAERRALGQLKPQPKPKPEPEDRPYHLEVRARMLADLATWPAAFRRRVREEIEWRTQDDNFAEDQERALDRARAPEPDPTDMEAFSGCGCGCWGFHSELASELKGLRRAVADYRSVRTPRTRAERKRTIDREKTDVLECLWLHGRRKIDRKALAEHAIEEGRREIGRNESSLERAQGYLAYYRERLKSNRYLKGPKKGRPLSPQTRYGFRLRARNARTEIPSHRARIRQLRRLLKNVPALVREYTGCERQATDRSAANA